MCQEVVALLEKFSLLCKEAKNEYGYVTPREVEGSSGLGVGSEGRVGNLGRRKGEHSQGVGWELLVVGS